MKKLIDHICCVLNGVNALGAFFFHTDTKFLLQSHHNLHLHKLTIIISLVISRVHDNKSNLIIPCQENLLQVQKTWTLQSQQMYLVMPVVSSLCHKPSAQFPLSPNQHSNTKIYQIGKQYQKNYNYNDQLVLLYYTYCTC